MLLKSVSNKSFLHFHYDLFLGMFHIIKFWRDKWEIYIVICGKNLDFDSLYFHIYSPWKGGFLNGPEISFKLVRLVFFCNFFSRTFQVVIIFRDIRIHIQVSQIKILELYLNNWEHDMVYKFDCGKMLKINMFWNIKPREGCSLLWVGASS